MIGLEHPSGGRLFFLENLAVGGAALLLGLAAGDLLFQALRAVMLALVRRAPTGSPWAFSPPAVGLTLVYFLFIYLFALLKGRRRIRRMKIRELIYLDRRNEEEVIEKSRSRRRIFVLSVILGAVGTLLLLMGGMLPSLLGTGCVIALPLRVLSQLCLRGPRLF